MSKETKIEGPAGPYLKAYFEVISKENDGQERIKQTPEHHIALDIINVVNQNSKKLDDESVTRLIMAAGTLFIKDPDFQGFECRQLIEQEF